MRAWETAYVFDADTDQFICCASMVNRVSGIATGINREHLKEGIARKKRNLKQVRAIVSETTEVIDGMHPREILALQAFTAKQLESATESLPAVLPQEIVTIRPELDRAVEIINKQSQPDDTEITYSGHEFGDIIDHDEDDDIWGLNAI